MSSKFSLFTLVQKLPLGFLIVSIGWNLYAYLIELCILDLIVASSNVALGTCYLCIFVLLMTLVCISLGRTILRNPGNPPSTTNSTSISGNEMSQQTKSTNDGIQSVFDDQGPFKCPFCGHFKPERCHHCSLCQKCILRMDHHCPWVNNCVGFRNYKFFFLFLLYSTITLGFVIGTTISRLAVIKSVCYRSGIVYIVNISMDGLFFLSAFGLFMYHSHLIITNKTTLESTEYGVERRKSIFASQGFSEELIDDNNLYDIGKFANVQQVLGKNPLTWFIPIFTSQGDGISYPKRISVPHPV